MWISHLNWFIFILISKAYASIILYAKLKVFVKDSLKLYLIFTGIMLFSDAYDPIEKSMIDNTINM